jgi:hypothetical protein
MNRKRRAARSLSNSAHKEPYHVHHTFNRFVCHAGIVTECWRFAGCQADVLHETGLLLLGKAKLLP